MAGEETTQALDAPVTESDVQKATEVEKTEVAATDETADQSATDQESDKTEGEHDDEGDKPRRASGIQRLKQRLAVTEAKLAEAERSRGSDSANIDALVEKRLGPPPKEADFNGDYLAYERELTAYTAAKYGAKYEVQREVETSKQRAELAKQETQEDHIERVREAEKRIPDYKDVVQKAGKMWFSDALSELVVESDKSGDLLYHLAKNPNTVAELNELSPSQAARRIGQIEARLSVPQPKKATGAPAPNAALRGGAAPALSPEAALDAWIGKTYKR